MLDDMTRPLRRFDPFRPIDMLTSLWSSAAMAPVSSGAAAAYRTLFMTVRRLVVGRRLAVGLERGDLTLTITEFDSRLDVRGLSVGQLNDVRLAARDIHWEGSRFDHATAVLHNVHLRPTAPPVLVAAPIELTLEVPTAALDELFRWAAPRLSGEVGADGIARLRLVAQTDARPPRGRRQPRRVDAVVQTARPRHPPVAMDAAGPHPGLCRAPSRPAPRPASSPASASHRTSSACRARCRSGVWSCRENGWRTSSISSVSLGARSTSPGWGVSSSDRTGALPGWAGAGRRLTRRRTPPVRLGVRRRREVDCRGVPDTRRRLRRQG